MILYVVIQITKAEEYYGDESARTSWIVFWSVVGGGILVVAFRGNWMRWKVFEQWILMSGLKKSARYSKKKKKGKRGVIKMMMEWVMRRGHIFR